MHIHQLRYLVAIVETGSVTKAAERCFVSQPSISQQMSKLEDSVGQKFFDRSGGKQQLTEAGQLMYQQARKILGSVDVTQKMMKDVKQAAQGRIAIGINPAIGPLFLPAVLHQLSTKFPKAMIEIRECTSEVLQKACARDELDVVITSNPLTENSLVSELLVHDPFYIAMNTSQPLATRDTVGLEDLNDTPFILLDDIHCLARQIEYFCFDQQFIPKVLFQASQIATVKQLILSNYGISILPGLARDPQQDQTIKYYKIDNDNAQREVLLLKKPNQYANEVTTTFIQIVREYCAGLVA